MKNLIKKILKEESSHSKKSLNNPNGFEGTDVYDSKDEVALGLSMKALNHLVSALRDIESALECVENEKLRDTLEEVREHLMTDYGRQESFASRVNDEKHVTLINMLGDAIDDNSNENWNFNLNGSGTKAPEGVF
jgi:ABC-type ATPase with predicted acetyltransferase domain